MMKWRSLKITLFILLICIIIFRLTLPYFLLHYVTQRVNRLPDYRVQIDDLSVEFFNASYTLHKIKLYKVNKNIPVPYLSIKALNLALDWNALLKAKFVGQISALEPVINLVVDPAGNNEQLSINAEWKNIVESLFPLNFNKITISQGELIYRSYTAKPPFKLDLKDISARVENMQAVTHAQNQLSSSFEAHAVTVDGAPLVLKGRFDPFQHLPTFYFTLTLKNMAVQPTNNFLRHYIKLDVKSGIFSVFVELAAKRGEVKGYIKPFIQNLQIADAKDNNPLEALYKGTAQLVANILTNPEDNTVATQVNVSGNITNPDTNLFSILIYLISHAFLNAVIPQIDHSIKMQDIHYSDHK